MLNQMSVSKVALANDRAGKAQWAGLYRLGGISALVSLLFFPVQIAIFFTNPYPADVPGWFALLARSPLVGLIELDLLLLIDEILLVLILLALYVALKDQNQITMLWSSVLGILSAVLFIASNPAFSMLSLANQYHLAVTEVEKTILTASGQAIMSIWIGSGWEVAYFVGSIAPIVISIVMLKNPRFSKATAYFGIVSNLIALGKYVPTIGIFISLFSVVLLWVWYLLLGVDLLKIVRTSREATLG